MSYPQIAKKIQKKKISKKESSEDESSEDESSEEESSEEVTYYKGQKKIVLASGFDDKKGSYENNLYDGGYYYAELSTNPLDERGWRFKALGELPKYYKLKITYNGKSIIAKKGDKGRGGPSYPKIDIHKTALAALGVNNPNNFLKNVEIEYLGV